MTIGRFPSHFGSNPANARAVFGARRWRDVTIALQAVSRPLALERDVYTEAALCSPLSSVMLTFRARPSSDLANNQPLSRPHSQHRGTEAIADRLRTVNIVPLDTADYAGAAILKRQH